MRDNTPSSPTGGFSRRSLLASVGIAAAGAGLAFGAGTPSPARAQTISTGRPTRSDTRLVLLGTAGGPAVLDGARAGISSVVVYRDTQYIVDLGVGSMHRLSEAKLGPTQDSGSSLARVKGIFFTHMHSDHTMDWPALWATGTMNAVGRTAGPVQVFGPGDRGALVRSFPPNRPEPPIVAPEDPTPGIAGMTSYLARAFAQDLNDRIRDSGMTPPTSMFEVHDIDLAGIWDVDPGGRPPRLTAPIPVWTDGDVRVTATLVDHHPTAPAFAFRFDTPDGAIVFSGDTGVSQNLIDLAKDADILVHEVIDPQWVDTFVATLPVQAQDAVRQHLLESHTTIEQVGRDVAEVAGAKNLVLSHIAPANADPSRLRRARKGYSGRLIVGEDLMSINV